MIYLSGSGADEIFSDYGYNGIKHFRHSTIGGKFPEDLETVFPWKNFFDNTQRAYLMKEEYVSGSHGIEGRYPFLDKEVVQEFLWLKPELKNKFYKSVLHNYMEINDYPFDISQKVGFNCGFSGNGDGEYIEKKSTHRTVGETKDETLVVKMDLEITNSFVRNRHLCDYLRALLINCRQVLCHCFRAEFLSSSRYDIDFNFVPFPSIHVIKC